MTGYYGLKLLGSVPIVGMMLYRWFYFVCVALLASGLSACGGGGGGGGASGDAAVTVGTTTVFASGNPLNGAKHMVFKGTDLYVANQSGNQILKIDASGVQSVFSTAMSNPYGILIYGNDVYTSGVNAGTALPAVSNLGTNGVVVADKYSNNLKNFYGIAATSAGVFYVTDITQDDVIKIAVGGGATAINVGNNPTGLAINGTDVYVTLNVTGTVVKIDSTNTVSAFANGLHLPNGLAFDGDGNLYVVNFGGTNASPDGSLSSVSKITPAGAVTELAGPGVGLCSAAGIAISGNYAYVSNGTCTADASKSNRILKIKI